eukprot:11247982-Alexandrium_andersonii.AAC.1
MPQSPPQGGCSPPLSVAGSASFAFVGSAAPSVRLRSLTRGRALRGLACAPATASRRRRRPNRWASAPL